MVVKYREMDELGGNQEQLAIMDPQAAQETRNKRRESHVVTVVPSVGTVQDDYMVVNDEDDMDEYDCYDMDTEEDVTKGFLPNGKALLVAAAAAAQSAATGQRSAGAGASGSQLFRNRFSTKGSGASRRLRKRVVFKNGDCNVTQANVAKRRRRYLADIFTTLVDIQWRWNLMVFSMGFILSWLGFAIVWWLICFTHGDLEHAGDAKWTPCINNVHSFTSAFLFSIETQHTIGYGSRYTTEECPEAIFIMCLQSIVGVMIQAFMVGVVFAKLSRPKKRTQTLLFSRQAVICQRDHRLCLMFRLGDMRKSHIIQAQVRAHLIRKRVTPEDEVLPHHLHEMKVFYDAGENQIFFIWPMTIVHVIDETSPFYRMSARDLHRDNFEIVVILEGCIESTGMTTQARSSYLPTEILWGHRFEQLVHYRKEDGEYAVDYSRFNNTYEVDTPLCSGRDLEEWRKTGGSGKPPPPKKPLPSAKHLLVRSRSFDNMKGKQRSERKISSPSPPSGPAPSHHSANPNPKSTEAKL